LYDGIPYHVKQRAGDRGITEENMEKSQHTDFRKNEVARQPRLDAFKMKGLRKILRVSWTAKKTNEWVLNKARVKKNC